MNEKTLMIKYQKELNTLKGQNLTTNTEFPN